MRETVLVLMAYISQVGQPPPTSLARKGIIITIRRRLRSDPAVGFCRDGKDLYVSSEQPMAAIAIEPLRIRIELPSGWILSFPSLFHTSLLTYY